MLSLLIIADDFTGALDTGVQFPSTGLRVKVTTDIEFDFRIMQSTDVLVMDTETRHCSAAQAYRRVYRISTRAIEYRIQYILKKTDSGLRGNIGSELTALLDAAQEKRLPFIPAFPQMKRTTIGGIQYFDGVLVEQSMFGMDPFNPVTTSYIPDIIGRQSKVPVSVIRRGHHPSISDNARQIEVYDAETDEDIRRIAKKLHQEHGLSIMAGCAGLASVLPDILQLRGGGWPTGVCRGGLLVINGSLNPITAGQLKNAEHNGFPRVYLRAEQKLETGYWSTGEGQRMIDFICSEYRKAGCCIIDTIDVSGSSATRAYINERAIPMGQLVKRIPETLGAMAAEIFKRDKTMIPMVIGGDTLQGILDSLGVHEIEPICEITPGTVLSVFEQNGEKRQILSKSGGFGEEGLLIKIADILSVSADCLKRREL